ncbi:hypothetical protein BCR42DRAFT_450649 [Absidia repens]|uniref:LysM domain-containing protein n=1 Tax=Absidia repens TaxID=90262 RepID=A0A1X2IKR0_9FUNG|nr:hypothetical protein BCR42DRAFT_450649 [Absidia repens]
MHLPTLSTLGLFVLATAQFVSAQQVITDDVEAAAPQAYSDYYLSAFGDEDAPEADFELVERDDYASDADIPETTIELIKRAECTKHHTVHGNDNCINLSKKYGIKLDQFYSWNPQVNHKCTNLNDGKKYCVGTGSSSSSSSSDKSSSSSGCAKTHKVTSSDTCAKLAKSNGISLNTFYDLNPKVHRGSCDNLDNGKSYCVKAGSKSSDNKSVSDKVTKLGSKVNKSSSKKSSSSSKKKSSSSKKKSKRPSTSSSKKEKRKKLQTNTSFTYYWIATPDSYKTSGKKVTIKSCSGKSLGKVSEDYGDALVMEGSGVLGSKIVNLGGCSCSNYKCFEEVDKKDDPFGLTANGSPLRPYITIAANDLKMGTKVYIPQLVGWSLPGSKKKHNGCALVNDQSWSFGSHHIDFYIYKQKNYKTLDKQHRTTKVDIYEGGSCTIQNYL